VINAKDEWKFKTIVLDINTMKKIEEVEERLLAFFKSVYNEKEKKWYRLDFKIWNENEPDEELKYKKWSFILQKVGLSWKPMLFNRKRFLLETDKWTIDIWDASKN